MKYTMREVWVVNSFVIKNKSQNEIESKQKGTFLSIIN